MSKIATNQAKSHLSSASAGRASKTLRGASSPAPAAPAAAGAPSSTPLTIDQQISQLDAAIEWFYSDDFSLAQAVDKYQSAIQIAQSIDQNLDQLENQVKVLSQDFSKS